MAYNPWKGDEFNEKRTRVLSSLLQPKQAVAGVVLILVVLFGGFLVIPHTFFHGGMDWFFLILYAVLLTGGSLFLGHKIELFDEKEDA